MTVHVLVVEDEEIAAAAHAEYVGRVSGFEVAAVARSGVEALRALGHHTVDLVLLDMHLPDVHGLELLQRMRADGHLCDVIAVTSARDLDVVKRAVAGPGDRIEIRAGTVYLNGTELEEPHVKLLAHPALRRNVRELTLGAGQWYMLSDNRFCSAIDSSSYGPVSEDRFIGKPIWSIWRPR